MQIDWTQVIVAGMIVLGGGGTLTLKKLGFTVTKKSKVCPTPFNANECPDPKCQSQVELTAKDVGDIKEQIGDKVWPTLDGLGKAVVRIDERTEIMMDLINK